MEALVQDIRFSLRTMAKNPGFIAAAVVCLALGIGPNTVIFSMVNALLLRPLPVDRPDQLVRLFRSEDNGPYNSISYPDYIDYRSRQEVFTGLAACQRMMMSLNIAGQPESIPGAVASANFFSILGVQPTLGRAYTPEEDRSLGGHSVAIISYNLWQRRFNADAAILGRTLRLNGQSFTVIGVAPKGFTGIDAVFTTDVWVPITMYPKLKPSSQQAFDPVSGREQSWLNDVIGRLKPGVSVEQARSSLSGISAQLDSDYPSRRLDRRRIITLVPISSGQPAIRSAILSFSALLMAIACLVLLIVCANMANLLLARAAVRRREIAIRLAIGANRWRVVRQLLTESVMLALIGGGLGVLLTYWASDLLLAFRSSISIPMAIDLSIDRRVLGFSLAISFLTGIILGLPLALRISRADLGPILKTETTPFGHVSVESRLHSLFVIAQVALSLVLLIGAALLFRSMRNAYGADPGFEKKNLMLLSTDLDLRGFTASEGKQFYQRLIDRVQTLPGLRSASLTSVFPLSLAVSKVTIAVEGSGSQSGSDMTEVGTMSVTPGYFETMGIPLIQGRVFSPHDTETAPDVAIINQTMARRFWAGEDPIGKRIKFDSLASDSSYSEVIGVVKDSKFLTLGESPQPFMYECMLQRYSASATLVARTESSPERMLASVRREAQSLDGDLPIFDVKTVTEHMEITLLPLKIATTLLGFLGSLALLLASVGLYAAVAYSVALRTRELGIRMVLGARAIQILKQVITRGTALVLIGILIGLTLAYAMARAMSSLDLLYGISAIDPATFLGTPLLLIFVAIMACYVPARRATKIDPAIVIRQE
jgi:macrolide transport system ATP-binding/permease protein